MPSSISSTISSLLELNDEQQMKSDDSNESYKEEFESESLDERTVVAVAACDSSSYEKYTFEMFENDQEASIEKQKEKVEDDEYEDESFEEDEQEFSMTVQQEGNAEYLEDEKSHDTMENSLASSVERWCFKKIQHLRAGSLTKRMSKPQVCKSQRVVDEIPANVVQKIIQHTRGARHQKKQSDIYQFNCRQKWKIPMSVIQQAQTQLWLAKSCNCCEDQKTVRESLTSYASFTTFCSVKLNDLRGQLTTAQSVPQSSELKVLD
ncbi:hypothetical protein Plhal304r1_c079g0165601 [Plasmopara halstedii]